MHIVLHIEGDPGTILVNSHILNAVSFSISGPLTYDIAFTHDSTCESLKYSKRLLNGWQVEITEELFLYLAYSPENNDNKNIHALCVRGQVLKADDPKRHCTITCNSSAAHEARNAACKQWATDTEERAQYMLHPSTDSGKSFLEMFSHKDFESNVAIENLRVSTLHLVRLETVVVHFYNGSMYLDQQCTKPCENNDILEKLIQEVMLQNLNLLFDAYLLNIDRASFQEKISYWKTLRSSEANSQKLLCSVLDSCLVGAKSASFESCVEILNGYKNFKCKDLDYLVNQLVLWQASFNLSTGFATGFGGFLTMTITIPAGLLAAWMTASRLAFSIAYVYGHDIFHPTTCNAVLYCLTGSSDSDEDELRIKLEDCLNKLSTANGEDYAYSKSHALALSKEDLQFVSEYSSLYELLGVSHDATQHEIRTAFRKLAVQYHPDKLKQGDDKVLATQQFQILAAAYDELGDTESRKIYDAKLRKGIWSWEFVRTQGAEKAKNAFERVSEVLHADHHDLSIHIASRATIQSVESVVTKTLTRAATTVEIEASIIAGEKLAARATASSASKFIPLVGALFSGVIDCATTASVGRAAKRVFAAKDRFGFNQGKQFEM